MAGQLNEGHGDVTPKGILFSQPFVVLTPVGVDNPKSLVNRQISNTKPHLAVSRKFRPGQHVSIIAFCCFNLGSQLFQAAISQFQRRQLYTGAFTVPRLGAILVEEGDHG